MSADYDFDLGTVSFPVSTQSAEAQRWFDRGLVWCYAFAHEEAVRCFRRAAEHDPDCAMAWWGVGYAAGPYYNKQWHKFDPDDLERTLRTVRHATRQALDRIEGTAAIERALVEALARRYPSSEPGDFDRWNDDYAGAMREAYRSFPDSADVCALFAEALLNRTPGRCGTSTPEHPRRAPAPSRPSTCWNAASAPWRRRARRTIPACSTCTSTPWRCRRTRSARSAPRTGCASSCPTRVTLRHMPTHIDIQCGYYQATVDWNASAVAVDRKLFERDEDPGVWHTLSFAHNYHFMLYGAMFSAVPGRDGSDRRHRGGDPRVGARVESPPMADWLEGFVAMQVHAPVRFGRWRENHRHAAAGGSGALLLDHRDAPLRQGLAHAVLGDVPAAREEQALFEAASAGARIAHRVQQHLRRHPRHRGRDAAGRGELPRRRSRYRIRAPEDGDSTLRGPALRRTRGWMQPPRHALGALLLEQGGRGGGVRLPADLGLDDEVPGPAGTRRTSGACTASTSVSCASGTRTEARLVAPRLVLALARTDVPIESSCLCRAHCVVCPPGG